VEQISFFTGSRSVNKVLSELFIINSLLIPIRVVYYKSIKRELKIRPEKVLSELFKVLSELFVMNNSDRNKHPSEAS
jgi:hypothetical protein